MQKKWTARHLAFVCSGAYCLLMALLLFGRERYDLGLDYWKTVSLNYNFMPFRTIWLYIRVLINGRQSLYRDAVVNLAGNVVLFVPLGFLLPMLWPKLRKFWRCLGVSLLAVGVVELIQLFTLVGKCDIDDVILNLVGVSVGYVLYQIPEWLVKKKIT